MSDSVGSVQRALQHPTILRAAGALSARVPRVIAAGPGHRMAAVALLLREGANASAEMLLIQRATYAGDPWSGHIALPGGRAEQGDIDLLDTVSRETREELAVDLRHGARVLGSLDDVAPSTPRLPPIIIRPYVAVVPSEVVISMSAEVADSFWVPLTVLTDPAARTTASVNVRDGVMRVQGFQLNGRLVWGLTERILSQFVTILRA